MILGAGAGGTPCVDADTAECQAKSYLCTNGAYKELMTKKCPATCGFCSGSGDTGMTTAGPSGDVTTTSASGSSTCTDVNSADCEKKKSLCTNALYKDLMMEKCAATCGFC